MGGGARERRSPGGQAAVPLPLLKGRVARVWGRGYAHGWGGVRGGGPSGGRCALRVSVAPPQRHLHPHRRGCRDDVRGVSGLLRGHPGVPVPAGDGKVWGRVGAGGGCRGRTQSSAADAPCPAQTAPPLASVILERGLAGWPRDLSQNVSPPGSLCGSEIPPWSIAVTSGS